MMGWWESHLCLPRNETVQPRYFQNRIIMFFLPIPTLKYLWEIYIFPGLVGLFRCIQICGPILGIYINRSETHECRNWDWGHTIPFPGTHKLVFRYSAGQNQQSACGGGKKQSSGSIREKVTLLSVSAWYGAAAHAGDGGPDQIVGGHQQATVQRQEYSY